MVFRALVAGVGVYSVYLGLLLALGTECTDVGFSFDAAPELFTCASSGSFVIHKLAAAALHILVGLAVVIAARSSRAR